jgi:signal recognition particle subunit SRP54
MDLLTVDKSKCLKCGICVECCPSCILSMTEEERQNPKLMSFSRKKRIAAGSGTTLQDINSLIKEFEMMNKMMKEFKNNKKFAKKLKGMFK